MSHFGVLLAPFFSSFAHHVGWFVVYCFFRPARSGQKVNRGLKPYHNFRLTASGLRLSSVTDKRPFVKTRICLLVENIKKERISKVSKWFPDAYKLLKILHSKRQPTTYCMTLKRKFPACFINPPFSDVRKIRVGKPSMTFCGRNVYFLNIFIAEKGPG